jgi:hypothetical protein|tara:strand:+ start:145958 stop:146077 length:120 start_codon:yes stop_codon:yes gene_type:complete
MVFPPWDVNIAAMSGVNPFHWCGGSERAYRGGQCVQAQI